MKRLLFLCGLFPLIIISASEIELQQDGIGYRGEIAKNFEVSAGGQLVMEKIKGAVIVVGESRDNVVVTERFRVKAYSKASAEKILQDEMARYIQRGKKVVVEGRGRSRRYNSHYEVKLPSRFDVEIESAGGNIDLTKLKGTIDAETSGGDITIADIESAIRIKTSGGDISAYQCKGDIGLYTSGGDVDIEELRGELQVKSSGGDIFIEDFNGSGDVRTSGGDISLVRIKGDEFEAETSGGDIGADEVDIRLTLTTSGGDIFVGESGNDVKLHTSGGDIEVDRVIGRLAAQTSGGDIEVGYVQGLCKLHTSGGDIEVEKVLDNIEIRSSGGDIIILSALGTITAHTYGGDLDVTKRYHSRVKNNRIEMVTAGGEIDLQLPVGMPADIKALIKLTRSDLNYQIDSDFSLEVQRQRKGGRTYLRGDGTINGGGDLIYLETTNGDINIQKYKK